MILYGARGQTCLSMLAMNKILWNLDFYMECGSPTILTYTMVLIVFFSFQDSKNIRRVTFVTKLGRPRMFCFVYKQDQRNTWKIIPGSNAETAKHNM